MKRLKEQLLKRKTILVDRRKRLQSFTNEELKDLANMSIERFDEGNRADSFDAFICEIDSILNLIEAYER